MHYNLMVENLSCTELFSEYEFSYILLKFKEEIKMEKMWMRYGRPHDKQHEDKNPRLRGI